MQDKYRVQHSVSAREVNRAWEDVYVPCSTKVNSNRGDRPRAETDKQEPATSGKKTVAEV